MMEQLFETAARTAAFLFVAFLLVLGWRAIESTRPSPDDMCAELEVNDHVCRATHVDGVDGSVCLCGSIYSLNGSRL